MFQLFLDRIKPFFGFPFGKFSGKKGILFERHSRKKIVTHHEDTIPQTSVAMQELNSAVDNLDSFFSRFPLDFGDCEMSDDEFIETIANKFPLN